MTSRPIEDVIEFEGQKVYREDVSMVPAELATRMRYRDAATKGGLFTGCHHRAPSTGGPLDRGRKPRSMIGKVSVVPG